MKGLFTLIFITSPILFMGQDVVNLKCFDAHDIIVPLNRNEYVLQNAGDYIQHSNILYYLFEDEYTFWYRIEVEEAGTLNYSVFSTNNKDKYDNLLYKYNQGNFCYHLINNKIIPEDVLVTPILPAYDEGGYYEVAYQNSQKVESGDIYYLSVIGLNADGCGHKLYLECDGIALLVNAVKKPCFNYQVLDEADEWVALTSLDEAALHAVLDSDVINDYQLELSNNSEKFLVQSERAEELINLREMYKRLPLDDNTTETIESADTRIRMSVEHDQLNPYDAKDVREQSLNKEPGKVELTNLEISPEDYRNSVSKSGQKVNGISPNTVQGVADNRHLEKIKFFDWKTGEEISHEKITKGASVVLDKIYFHNNTYAFRHPATRELDKLAQYLSENPGINIEIQGHTAGNSNDIKPDPSFKLYGTEWNFKGNAKKLSKMRAEAVKKYLVGKGISANRLTTIGLGDERRLIENPNNFSESSKNMRVELKILEH